MCIDAESGELRWQQEGISEGGMIRAGEHLLIQTGKSGELIVADADPEKFTERSRIKVFDAPSRTAPSFASGRVFCRSANGDVVCLGVPVVIEY